jgi:hypothetical protein
VRRVKRFLELDGDERSMLTSAAFRLLAVRMMVAALGAPRTIGIQGRRLTAGKDPSIDSRAVALSVLRADRTLRFNANCLDRALAVWWLLSERGIDSTLRIGVKESGGRSLPRTPGWNMAPESSSILKPRNTR